MTLTIGLTGGIGSGKSTVARLFQKLGVPVFDTDVIAKELTRTGEPALQEIINIFGNELLDKAGNLNRELLKKKVFHNDKAREKLENILHPKIREQLTAYLSSTTAPYCIAVIPLLIEKNWRDIVDRILVVDLSKEQQLTRTTSRDNVVESLVQQITNAQVDRDTRLGLADDIINNSGSESQLANRVNELHEKYLTLAHNN